MQQISIKLKFDKSICRVSYFLECKIKLNEVTKRFTFFRFLKYCEAKGLTVDFFYFEAVYIFLRISRSFIESNQFNVDQVFVKK